jgi:hypothetical protein
MMIGYHAIGLIFSAAAERHRAIDPGQVERGRDGRGNE